MTQFSNSVRRQLWPYCVSPSARRLFHEDPDRIKRGVTWLAGSTF